MTPGSFDAATSREMVGDERARVIEAKARADADSGEYDPPKSDSQSYWGQCQEEFALRVYLEQFRRRRARNERKAVS